MYFFNKKMYVYITELKVIFLHGCSSNNILRFIKSIIKIFLIYEIQIYTERNITSAK